MIGATRERLLAMAPAPAEAVAHGAGTDVDGDLEILWAVVRLLEPHIAVELGTRQAVSTRTLVHALATALPPDGQPLITIDPDPACRPFLRGLACNFLQATGEDVYRNRVFARHLAVVDFLFIDTDPHTYDQTRMWLDTWVQRVRVGGVAAFHDIVAARPEMQVAEAVRDWMKDQRPEAWAWREYPSPADGGGVGLLWRLS